MKLGSLKGGRDGRLVVVSSDLAWCADAGHIAPTLQAALDDWAHVAPRLDNLATDLAHETIPMMRFHEREAAAPLPRAYARLDAASSEPSTLHPSPSNMFGGARDPVPQGAIGASCQVFASVVAVTDDVPAGCGEGEALAAVRLVGLVADLRTDAPAPLASLLSPVFVTPDELGAMWHDGTLTAPLKIDGGGAKPDGDATLLPSFGALIVAAAQTRPLSAGALIVAPCGSDATSLSADAVMRIWIEDDHGHPIFGTIEQHAAAA